MTARDDRQTWIDAWTLLSQDDEAMYRDEYAEWWEATQSAVTLLRNRLWDIHDNEDVPTMVPVEALGILAARIRHPNRFDWHVHDEMIDLICQLGDMAGEARDNEALIAAQQAERERRNDIEAARELRRQERRVA